MTATRKDYGATQVTVRRVRPNMIEYEVVQPSASGPEYPEPERRVYHANREATFFGPHTGAPARQISGVAHTFWRDTDIAMFRAFRLNHPNAVITIDDDRSVERRHDRR